MDEAVALPPPYPNTRTRWRRLAVGHGELAPPEDRLRRRSRRWRYPARLDAARRCIVESGAPRLPARSPGGGEWPMVPVSAGHTWLVAMWPWC
jgi:hypothetical protein